MGLAVLQLVLVILWPVASSTQITQTKATIPAATLVFVVSIGFCTLSWYEHARNVRPSSILDVYLFLSLIFDTARTRTLWLLGQHHAIPIVFTCTVAVRCLMLVLESWEKRSILVPMYKEYSKEATSGTFSRSVFLWLTSLFLNGYSKVLSMNDLFVLDKHLYAEDLQRDLQQAWDQVPDQTRKGALMFTFLKVQAWAFALAAIPRLFRLGFVFAQPFLINEAINLAYTPNTPEFNNIGYGLIGAYVFVYVGFGISNGRLEHRLYRIATMMRGAIIPMIYRKTLQLDNRDVKASSALTHFSTDIEAVITGVIQIHEIWGSLLEMGLAMYLLELQLGVACVLPLGIAIVALAITGFIAVPIGTSHAAWVKASEKRVSNTSKTLGNMKWLRLSGLNDVAFEIIHKLRVDELRVSKTYRTLLLGVQTMSDVTPVIAPVLTFALFAILSAKHENDTLTIAKAFTSLSILGLLTGPLASMPIVLALAGGSVTSFQRIQNYLVLKPREDRRSGFGMANVKQRDSSSQESSDHEKFSSLSEKKDLSGIASNIICDDVVISMKGKFSWPEAEKPVIEIDEWEIKRKSLTIVLGPVGCGKSTLLKAILGELSDFDGNLHTSYKSVAYCAQTPWLPNETVRSLVLGNDQFDEKWYRTVMTACALDQDLTQWPDEDRSLIGSKGISLSGGQKHRLSLARAIYARKDLLLIDDAFSGLDATTEHTVFQNLLGERGLLRDSNATIVIASSDIRRAPYADQIVILSAEGKIDHQGTITELRAQLGSLTDLDLTKSNSISDEKARTKPADELRASEVAKLTKIPLTEGVEGAALARQTGDASVYYYYFGSASVKAIVVYLVCIAIYGICRGFPSIWLKWWADANVISPNSDLGKWLGVYAAFSVAGLVALLIGLWDLFVQVVYNSGLYFHSKLATTVSRAQMAFFTSVDNGVTLNRFSQDLELIDMELPLSVVAVTVCISLGTVQAVLMAVASRYIAIAFPFIILVFYIIQRFYLRTSRQLRFLDIEYKAPLYTQLTETLSGLTTIRAFEWEADAERKNWKLLDESQRPAYLLYCLQRWLILVVDMVIAVMAIVLVVIIVTLREQLGPGFIGVALSQIMAFNQTIKGGLITWTTMEISIGAVARVKNFVGSVKPEDESDEDEGKASLPSVWPSKGALEIRDLTASYISSGIVLRNVSLSVKPGEKVGICGRTGSGKSSLVLCLFRMLDLESGSIHIDGIDITHLPHDFVRSNLVAVPQEVYIFDGTIRKNVDPTGNSSDEDILRVLEKVQLLFAVQQRGGLDTIMDETFFSQGQTQLLSFARAMLRDSKILFLDEATSSLNEETSNIIEDLLSTWFQGWTVLAIAHKLDSIIGFDKVAVLDDGQLVEFDSPNALLARDSVFRSLYRDSQKGASKKVRLEEVTGQLRKSVEIQPVS
ncbi:hypothetical protein MMC25_007706 [Agyrium rufum]|nr:hypothetical protein [Agyrium rufum]